MSIKGRAVNVGRTAYVDLISQSGNYIVPNVIFNQLFLEEVGSGVKYVKWCKEQTGNTPFSSKIPKPHGKPLCGC